MQASASVKMWELVQATFGTLQGTVALVICIMVLLYSLSPTFAFNTRQLLLNVYVAVAAAIILPILVFRGRSEKNILWCSRSMIPGRWLFGIRKTVLRSENMIQDKPCVIVANHQSVLDLFGLSDLVTPRSTFVVKKELLYYGPIGLCFWLAGAIFIDRQGKDGRNSMKRCAEEVVERNLQVWIYPEGTRNCNGGILPFKKGAFNLAVHGQIPIVPVVYKSYSDFYNPRKRIFTAGTYKVEVLPPVSTQGLGEEDVTKLCEDVRETMLKAYNRLSSN